MAVRSGSRRRRRQAFRRTTRGCAMAATGVIEPLTLPSRLEAAEPPEARGLKRDEVRLLVSRIDTDTIAHSRFSELPRWLLPGDLLVVNTSGTLNAALVARARNGDRFEVHLSTRMPGHFWVIEVRRPGPVASLPYRDARAGTIYELEGSGRITLFAPYPLIDRLDAQSRLWIAALELGEPVLSYLDRFGSPIRYGYVPASWPSSMYQTVFATEPGSAEMPSAARPFTPELVTRLISSGIQIAPLLLHTGVASLEDHEPPYEEFYRVPLETARLVNAARTAGKRVIAVGTTAVRALESVADETGMVHPGQGWTRLVITPDRRMRAVDALLTGLHEPRASHLAMLEALAGVEHLRVAYGEALRERYLWHEFGDLHLILP